MVIPAGPNLPPKVEYFIITKIVSTNVTIKEFEIDDAGITDLHNTWNSGRPWKREHDKILLVAVLKYLCITSCSIISIVSYFPSS